MMYASVWDDVEEVGRIVAGSTTRKEVIERLGRAPTSAMYRRLRRFEDVHNIDTSHYTPYKSSGRGVSQ